MTASLRDAHYAIQGPVTPPTNVCRQRREKKKNQQIKMKCAPHYSLCPNKENKYPTIIVYFLYEQRYGRCYANTCMPGEMAQNLQVLQPKN